MAIKSKLVAPIAKHISKKIKKDAMHAVEIQNDLRSHLIKKAKKTAFGVDHGFADLHSYQEFQSTVPIRDYEALKPYVDQVVKGKPDILWPGKPQYFAKTSGTTSGTKYIPITKESMPNHMNSARNSVFMYVTEKKDATVLDGKLIFLSGSPELIKTNGILTGRLSGIVNHHIPSWLKGSQLPTYKTNCIEDWESKLDAIVEETLIADMRMISGIPPWVLMYYEKIAERMGKPVGEVFPNFSLFVHGGVNFAPYAQKLEEAVGKHVDHIETYPSSEGFIAFQDSQEVEGLLLNTNSGIFFEFVKTSEYFDEKPQRHSIESVEIGEQYAVIINSNAGLWGYSIGDTVRFVSKEPYRVVVTGRIKHFISAFGEHVIAEEVENAMIEVGEKFNFTTVEFTVAPQVTPTEGGLPYHEWFVEFNRIPDNLENIAKEIDVALCKQNSYYQDLITGNVLQPLKLHPIKDGGFREFMKRRGKLGGQNKVPRLSNDRVIAEELQDLILKK